MNMIDTFFSYEMVPDYKVKALGLAPLSMKITEIKATDEGVVNIPETIQGFPVTIFRNRYNKYSDNIKIKKLIIPKTIVELECLEFFPGNVEELVVDKDNPKWSTDGVSLLSKDGTKLQKMCQKNRTSYCIPDGVTTICYRAFDGCKIIELTIPDSVTTVEHKAFYYGCSLKTVYGGKNIVHYEPSSFGDTEWYKSSPFLVLGTTLLRFDSMEENVVVPEGIEVIGPCAFPSRGGMETVKLPSTIREIGDYVFAGAENLRSINFPDGLQTIGHRAFFGCKSISEIVLPDSIVEIAANAFEKCSSVTKVVIPHAVSASTVYSLGEVETKTGVISASAFEQCTSLEHIEIPEGTVLIGSRAFYNCRSLKSIRIPETVKAIESKAFANCFELEELFLPTNCVELGRNVLPHTTTRGDATVFTELSGAESAKFSKIDVDPRNKEFTLLDGVLYSKNEDTLIACPSQYNAIDYTIPEGVKEIMPGAFEGCEKIKSVICARTVEKIGANAFASMKALEKIVLPPDCPVLEEGLFMDCANLKFIIWPNNVREIGKKCFDQTGIEDLAIPETVETIGEYAFSSIKAKRVRLPKNVKDISLSVFAGVPEIEVYDTIDSEAKPAADFLDAVNGHCNGKVGYIGILRWEGCFVAACNATWYDHTIIVRSAEDDSEKYRVKMPTGQRRKVYCTYASSWGKNAEFNFGAIDNIFKDLTADAKLDYAFNRLHWQTGISEEMLDTLSRYVARNAKDIAARVFKTDAVDDLVMLYYFGIVKKNSIDKRIDEATKAKAMKCKAWLLDWKNGKLSAKPKTHEQEMKTGKKELFDRLKEAKVGDYVLFGKYPQDKTGEKKDAVEWLILDKDENKMLVISRYALDCRQYNRYTYTWLNITWETCSLRKWLNKTFINTAFSADEKKLILKSTVTADPNPKYKTPPGNDTTDKVFLLSIQEAKKYFDLDEARMCEGTEYCFERGAYRCDVNFCSWRLRSLGHNSDNAAYIDRDGSVGYYGCDVVRKSYYAVRPAMWIKIES